MLCKFLGYLQGKRRRSAGVATYLALLCLFLLLGSSMVSFVSAADVTLSWDPSSEQQVSGYKIYYGTASRSYSSNTNIGKVTTYKVTGLANGTRYYFAVTSYNTSGNESAYSNEVSATTSASTTTCTYSTSPSTASFSSSGGAGSIGVTASSGCTWSASSGVSWVTINTGKTGAGNGTVGYSVAPNSSTTSRTAALTVAGKVFTITQSAAANTTSYVITATAGTGGTISPSGSISVRSGASKTFTITARSGYRVSNVVVDGISKGAIRTYTFTAVNAKHTIKANFRHRYWR